MQKFIFLFLFSSSFAFAQVIDVPANWPDSNWTISGTYNASALVNNPTTSDAFTFNDDAAGSGSNDDVIAESPVIDISEAIVAGENQLLFSGIYNHRDIGGFLTLDYFDADAGTWITIFDFEGNGSGSDYISCSNMHPFEVGLIISLFTPTQLSGFKYRFSYDDNDGFLWGFCIQQPAIVSSVANVPNCDALMTLPPNGATNVAIDSLITWSEATGFPEGYLVSIGTTDGGTDVLNAFDNGSSLSYDPTGLFNYNTQYFVTITPYNGVGQATSCTSTSFTTASEITCTNPTVNFSLMDNCDVGEEFFAVADVTDLGSATSVDVEDGIGGLVNLTTIGVVQLGPYTNGTNVVLTATNADDVNCVVTSQILNLEECPPDNDLCTNATELFCGDSLSGDTSFATENDEITDFCGTSEGAPGVWYSYSGTGDIVTLSLCGSSFDTKIQVYEGSCGALSCVTGNDDSCGFQSEVNFLSNVGTTYYVYVFGFGSNTGAYSLNVTCVPPPDPPVNDDCANAIQIVANPDEFCTNITSGTIYGATTSSEVNGCGGTANDDVWFQFEAVSVEQAINISNVVGDTQDLYHVLYEGSDCGSLTELYCSDPNQSLASNLTVGNTYFLRVYSWGSVPLQDVAFDICVFSVPPPMITDDTTYTIEELVEDILIDTDCSLVSNISYSTGTDFGSTNGIGYFEANGSSFPFESGLIMTTGDVLNAPGPETGTISDGSFSWPGDLDLENAIPGLFPGVTNNASVIEFDFIPIIDQISFDFIFAAEEYGTFQCTFTDAFAFLLTDPDGVTTNIALVPGTNDPISVLNVRDEAYNSNCPSVNPEYFGAYYGNEGLPALTNPTNFIGRTAVMTAMADVIPNETYRIKLVIADDQDTLFDSAVFLNAGSFNIGELDLGEDILLTSGNANCQGDEVVIDAGILPTNSSIEWYADGVLIEGETSSTISVIDTAVYSAKITINDTDCSYSDDVLVEFFQLPQPSFPDTSITKCANEAFLLEVDVANSDSLNNLTYTWYLNGNEIQSSADSSYLLSETTEENGTVSVEVTDDIIGCTAEAQIEIEFYENAYCIDLPQGLSPNGDGENDCLVLDHLDDREDITRIDIFNRLGVKVYELNEYIDQWCGTDQEGKKLPVGTYFYIVESRNQEPIKSWIYLNY